MLDLLNPVSALLSPFQETTRSSFDRDALLNGDVILETEGHTRQGGAVTAHMYLPLTRSQVWQHVTNYPRWAEYFPDLTHSEVLDECYKQRKGEKRLYQVAQKNFLILTAQVEVYLHVTETTLPNATQRLRFSLEKGSFTDFSANLKLQDYSTGTLLSYSVQATPAIFVPTGLIQQAMRMDLPANLRNMRRVMCNS